MTELGKLIHVNEKAYQTFHHINFSNNLLQSNDNL